MAHEFVTGRRRCQSCGIRYRSRDAFACSDALDPAEPFVSDNLEPVPTFTPGRVTITEAGVIAITDWKAEGANANELADYAITWAIDALCRAPKQTVIEVK